jgi:N-acylglucosamine-6-phosphate 2-epimerase
MSRAEKLANFISKVKGELIVSCQATPQEALFGSDIMAKMAISAIRGGAKGIRTNTPVDVKAIREAVDVPIIGLYKVVFPGTPVIITATIAHALAIAEAGADVIAIDATFRLHPEDEVPELIRKIHEQTDCLVMADISSFEEAEAAMISGADVVSTTLSGYTDYTPKLDGPDLELVKEIASKLSVPVFAEGRYHYPDEVAKALEYGATGVIVGGAVTRPKEITERFVRAIRK